MNKIIHNKLVRDRIPDIIQHSGKQYKASVLNDFDYNQALKRKLIEESNEVNNSKNTNEIENELADVLEVIDALIEANDLNIHDILRIKNNKAISNGKFCKKLFLEYVEES